MLAFQKPKNVKLIIGFIFSSSQIYQGVKKTLVSRFGEYDYESREIDFIFTDYYRREMGKDLKRRFISFKKLIRPEGLPNIKRWTVGLERRYSRLKKRRINIDPGYINEAKLVLSTTKDFSHRLYMGKGVFSEITLLYKDKGFQDLPWTFPDYRSDTYKEILLKIRTLYHNQICKKA